MNTSVRILGISFLTLIIAACGSAKPFHDNVRAGDTIAIPVGKQIDFNRNNITVTITPSIGSQIVLSANDPAIRGVINFYPDPVSSILVSEEISENLTPFAQTYFLTTHGSANNDIDWFQTVVFLDIPPGTPTGTTQIDISNPMATTHSSTLEIIAGTGTPNSFSTNLFGTDMTSDMLDALSRVSNTVVDIDSSTVPSAVELTFVHDPDVSIGGTGKYSVINPTGTKKGLHWSDDGINLKVILLQANVGSINSVKDFKFYIAGTASNLQLNSVSGYDETGTPISGVTANLSQH